MTDHSEPTDPAAAAPTTKDRVLLAVFWTWAGILVLATLAHLFPQFPYSQGVLQVLDVKNWFAR